jgi:hypothetical protein
VRVKVSVRVRVKVGIGVRVEIRVRVSVRVRSWIGVRFRFREPVVAGTSCRGTTWRRRVVVDPYGSGPQTECLALGGNESLQGVIEALEEGHSPMMNNYK